MYQRRVCKKRVPTIGVVKNVTLDCERCGSSFQYDIEWVQRSKIESKDSFPYRFRRIFCPNCNARSPTKLTCKLPTVPSYGQRDHFKLEVSPGINCPDCGNELINFFGTYRTKQTKRKAKDLDSFVNCCSLFGECPYCGAGKSNKWKYSYKRITPWCDLPEYNPGSFTTIRVAVDTDVPFVSNCIKCGLEHHTVTVEFNVHYVHTKTGEIRPRQLGAKTHSLRSYCTRCHEPYYIGNMCLLKDRPKQTRYKPGEEN